MQSLVAEVAQILDERGIRLPVFPSHNAGMTPEQRTTIESLVDAWYIEQAFAELWKGRFAALPIVLSAEQIQEYFLL